MTYSYYEESNKLKNVDGSTTENYTYDQIEGRALKNSPVDCFSEGARQRGGISDDAEGIADIQWTPYGKVGKVVKDDNSEVSFRYDASGNRIAKITDSDTTIYVRDASGNVMGVYNNKALKEQAIYGSSRLGLVNYASKTGYRSLGGKKYELTNHLGNVLAVVSDNIHLDLDSTWTTAINTTDYYPFGLAMDGRTVQDSTYSYGFNGMEADNEINGAGRSYTTEFRQYDPVVGRWWGVDPLGDHPNQIGMSPYSVFWNSPIGYNDPDGRCPICPLLVKAGANAAADFAAQTAMNYYFNPETAGDWGASSGAVNGWQITRSGLEGLIPWKTPGSRLGRAAGTSMGDVVANYLNDPGGYDSEQFYQDFTVGFIGDLAGGGLGELTSKYGSKAVAKGLTNLPGYNAAQIRKLTGHVIIGDYADKLAKSLGGVADKATGDGSVVKYGKYSVRMMYKGGERTSPYFRISKGNKGTIDASGNFNSDRGASHIEFTSDPTEQIQQIIKANENL
ncbi:RHS repeat-associated core domain-containing protein [Cyclobacterium lianum]|uniref:RHS repeat-associated core domain-containing protein n=1 Tax=Cyclobacterium lianum TaxID=388280 RepID=A0A1M7MD18_9BACT|nr:RHS repeat-associated core domain-containing protein [Cyclobacterium lianum]SHM88243.1 RHS repeat-associated core domain-containing protein [Cyclobacterium lianum]